MIDGCFDTVQINALVVERNEGESYVSFMKRVAESFIEASKGFKTANVHVDLASMLAISGALICDYSLLEDKPDTWAGTVGDVDIFIDIFGDVNERPGVRFE